MTISNTELEARFGLIGFNSEAIAEHFDVNPRTVRGWFAGERNGKPAHIPSWIVGELMGLETRFEGELQTVLDVLSEQSDVPISAEPSEGMPKTWGLRIAALALRDYPDARITP